MIMQSVKAGFVAVAFMAYSPMPASRSVVPTRSTFSPPATSGNAIERRIEALHANVQRRARSCVQVVLVSGARSLDSTGARTRLV